MSLLELFTLATLVSNLYMLYFLAKGVDNCKPYQRFLFGVSIGFTIGYLTIAPTLPVPETTVIFPRNLLFY